MAEKLVRYYNWVGERAGMQGQLKLAMETLISSMKAAMEPDSEDNVRLFREAAEKITGHPPPDFDRP